MPRRLKTDPQILDMPSQKMAVVSGRGSPDEVFAQAMPALMGAAYTLKFANKKAGGTVFKVGPIRARYPDLPGTPKEKWTINLAVPVPNDTGELPQKVPGVTVKLETWRYGTVGQILHLGGYAEETPHIERLRKYIDESGYKIAGPHEEEYLTMPDAKVVKTIIRYEVEKK
jgi:hypothetical protein